MTSTHPRADRSVPVAAWAVFVIFMLNGFNFASWASRLPTTRTMLGFSEAEMGVLLLMAAIGSLVALPLSGWITSRLGARRTIVVFALVNSTGMLLVALALATGETLLLRAALVLVGIGTGVWDAAMNLEGAVVEQRLGRTLMPRLHAGFSFGTIIGSGLGALAAFVGLSVPWHLVIAISASFLLVLVAVRGLLPDEPLVALASPAEPDAPRHNVFGAWLEPRTLLIGVVVLAAALTEGSANDWVGLAVVDGFTQTDAVGAVTLSLFLTAMTGMRLLGTPLLDRFGRVAVLRLASGLALVGLGIFALVPWLPLAFFGVVLWGMGAALGFPVGMSAAADDPVRAAGRVSVVSTIGYTAFFMGPPLIGMLAEHVGYRSALLVILVPIALGLLLAGAARPLPDSPEAERAAAR
ncbi:MFS transporter [Sanguibacter sp. HDW7]|uniref:MFS transporter n=1 Tax=Sanguibacter sp. HDW7 TaxID=2714931 RepID=UPI00140BF519|nr:MFS transporter [Sanguibacter sp. HDW7]QIK82691.1 MFS transporter [Sanguibacter sp. HDW7]